jgi:phage host-nuclease inhibitor protein Gam
MVEPAPATDEPLANDGECELAIGRLGEIDRELAKIEAAKSAAVARETSTAEQKATPLQAERLLLTSRVEAYCVENRPRLTDNGSTKTATFKSGTAAWKKAKDRVVVDETRIGKILEALKEKGLKRMIRVTEAINKTAIANEPDKVKGIRGLSIEEGAEVFSVTPVAAPLADTAPPPAA